MTEFRTLSERENYLQTIEMREPEWIPCRVSFAMATWHKHREKLEELVLRHPRIFPDFKKGSVDFDDFGLQRKDKTAVDEWGCVWHFFVDGLSGQVKEHPLADWSAFDSFKPPKPSDRKQELYRSNWQDWEEVRIRIEKARKEGRITSGGIGYPLFQRLTFLRGFKNLMIDFVTEHPRLQDLINILLDYDIKIIRKWLEIGVDTMGFGDDLGDQDRLPISPKAFRKYLFPAYKEMFDLSHEYGAHVHFHTDGHILEVAEELIEAGVDIINPQVSCNGIEGVKDAFKGKVCIDADVDRQYVLPFGSQQDVRNHIKEIVLKLGSKKGGLWIIAGCYPDAPLTNIEALCQAMEEYQCYYSNLKFCSL